MTLLTAVSVELQPQALNLQQERPEALFVLSASKRAYKVGEIIKISYRIENKGSKPFYVNPQISQLHGFDVAVIVSLYDRFGRRVPYEVTGHGPAPDYRRTDIVDHIRRHWLLLAPGTFYGSSGRYHTARAPGKGRYRLVATYSTNLLHVLTPSQVGSLGELDYPVLDGTYYSNEVWIDVRD